MESDSISSFADLLRTARREAELTQEELAERAGVSARGVSDLERGVIRAPRRDTLELLLDALDLDPEARTLWRAYREEIASQPLPPASAKIDVSRIVGRDRELAILRRQLSLAKAGQGRLVLVSGEAGIGKTTLVRDLVARAEAQSIFVLAGGCYDPATAPPFGPWSEAIRGYQRDGDQPPAPAWFSSSEEEKACGQAAIFEETRRFITRLAGVQPLLLVHEDLHWSDQTSLDLLRYLSHRVDELGAMIVATYRDDELNRRHSLFQLLPAIVREANAVRIELQRLDIDGVRELVTQYGLSEDGTEQLVAYLVQRGAGNPFFTTELLRSLEGEGSLQLDRAGARLGPLDEGYLPTFVLQVIERRLARLDSQSREALEIAAVIGQEAPFDLWEAVGGLQAAILDRAIEQALEFHFMEETANHRSLVFAHALVRDVLYQGMIPTRRRMWHRRAGEVLAAKPRPDPATIAHHFQQAGDERAIEWHIRAGRRTRTTAPFSAARHFEVAAAMLEEDERRAREVGWLRFEAGVLLFHSGEPRSIEHLFAAEQLGWMTGDAVLAAYACTARGLQHCARGEIRRGLIEVREGVAAADAASETLALPGVGEMAGHVQRSLSGAETGWDFQKGSRSDEDAGRPRADRWRAFLVNWLAQTGHYQEAVTVALDPAHHGALEVYSSHLGLGNANAALGQPDDARREFAIAQTGSQSLENLPILPMLELAIWSDLFLVVIPYQTDQLAERSRLVAEAMQIWDRCQGLTIMTAGAGAPSELQVDLLEGRWQKARELAIAHLSAPWISHVQEALMTLGTLARLQGESEGAWGHIATLHPQGPATEPGDSWFAAAIQTVALAADLALDAADPETARAWIETHERWLKWNGAVLWQPHHLLLQARHHQLTGNLDRARRSADAARECASHPRRPLALIAANRLLGELAIQETQFATAEEHLRASLTLAEACAVPYEQALAQVALAKLGLASGNLEPVGSLLDQARQLCIPLDARPIIERIEDLSSRLADCTAEPPNYPAGLTPTRG